MAVSAFRSALLSGVRWTAVANVALLGGSLIQTMILSRVLERKDFGLVAIASLVAAFLQLFADVGLSNALIARQDLSSRAQDAIYWANLLSGLLMSLVVAASAPFQAAFFSEPELTLVVWAMAPSFLVTAAGQPFAMIARREFRFHQVAMGNIIAALTLLPASVGLALAGTGPYALVFGSQISLLSRTIYYMAAGRKYWFPRLSFPFRELRGLFQFGLFQTLDRVCSYLWLNVQYVMIGRFMGPDPVALFRLASELPVRPMSFITPLVNTVAFPAFARKQADREAVCRGVLEITRFLATAVFPMLFGLAVTAPLVIPVVFGSKWTGAIPLVPILCLLAATRLLSNPVDSMLLGLGLVRLSFVCNAILAALAVPIFAICATISLEAVAWAAALIYPAVFIGRWRAVFQRPIGLGPKRYLAVLLKPAVFSSIMAGAAWLTMVATAGHIAFLPARLAVTVVAGASVYLGLLRAFDWPYVTEYARQLLRRGPARTGAGEVSGQITPAPAADMMLEHVSSPPARSCKQS